MSDTNSSQTQSTQTRPVQVKLVLLGEAAVGKSSLVLRFCQNDFQENKEPTIGAAFLTQKCRLEDKVIKFEIWDTAGQERFHSLAPMYYRNAAASLVVYDVTKAGSLEKAKSWVRELMRQASPNIVIALCGNKLDLVKPSVSTTSTSPPPPPKPSSEEEEEEDDAATATPETSTPAPSSTEETGKSLREVETEEARGYAEENGLLFFETSAKTGEGVMEVFTEIAKKIPLDSILSSSRGGGATSGPVGRPGQRGQQAGGGQAQGGNIRLGNGEDTEADGAKKGCAC